MVRLHVAEQKKEKQGYVSRGQQSGESLRKEDVEETKVVALGRRGGNKERERKTKRGREKE